MSIVSDSVRKAFKEGDDIRDAGLVTPSDVVRYDDLVYGHDHIRQSLDVYRPKGVSGILPVIVSVHGGGWVYGDKERYQYYCMSLAQHGFAVVNFTYRLAPEFKFPAPMEDTNSVFTWLLSHAQDYRFDVSNVFAVGDSAGAQILALYAAILTNPDYASQYDFSAPAGLRLNAIALNCGIAKIEKTQGDQTSSLMDDYLPGHGTEDELYMISPKYHVTKDYPPTFIMTSSGDFLKDEAPEMAQALMAKDVPFEYRFFGDPSKKLGHVFHCDMRLEIAAQCNREECDFFKLNMK